MKDRPSPAILRQLLRYEPDTGKLFWLTRDRSFFATDRDHKWWNARYAGKEAFTSISSDGYKAGSIFGKAYQGHCVAWAIHMGEWPSDLIDHQNGLRSDNIIENMKISGYQGNSKNRKKDKRNKSGIMGVGWSERNQKWRALLYLDGKNIHLGYFENFDDAKSARIAAQSDAGFHKNHGRLQ